MHTKGVSSDAIRVSTSSAPSTSSHGSAQDDYDSSGEVYVWGEVICDNSVRTGSDAVIRSTGKTDFLLPKPLESKLVLDVYHVDCGVKHAALVTKNGEVFTWGEESGGRLGHGSREDSVHPRLVELLAICNVDIVACGEFHTCAVTTAGELYTWGDGTHNIGLLGNGTDVSHWIPKRISGALEGLQVAYVSCGTWHTALITSRGQLFTFGDGTFGVLGHGNHESISCPREVESLSGLKTIAVACGVWHTAAVVEVIVTQSSSSISSGKLFTWGDGDKHRLGHGDKEPRLKPTCVASLIDYDFHRIACGHSLTVGLTTSGQVLSMGNTVYGQLGNPRSDGKLPCLVEDIMGEYVVQVACGSYHVAVLTNKSEVFTWGKGANGRLGHGDIEDRKIPTLVEALRDRAVRHIACGSNFTAAICQHKWVSGAEQSQCASCRQPFGFTRKRHNCHNCGLVHCNACTSRKAPRAALAPNPAKPYRVCDSCFMKLNSAVYSSAINKRKEAVPRHSGESNPDAKLAKAIVPSNMDMIRSLDSKAAKQGKKTDALSFLRTPQMSSLLQLRDIALSGGVDLNKSVPRAVRTSAVRSLNSSRAVSPFSRRPSPPRSTTPVPTTHGLSIAKNAADSLTKTNEMLAQEVERLRAQVDNLRHRCERQELELQKSAKKVQEAMALVAEESAKSKAAKEVIKSLTAQLKDMAERLPPDQGAYDGSEANPSQVPNGIEMHASIYASMNGIHQPRNESISALSTPSLNTGRLLHPNGISSQHKSPGNTSENSEVNSHSHRVSGPHDAENSNRRAHCSSDEMLNVSSRADDSSSKDARSLLNGEDGYKSRSVISLSGNQVQAEWIEQYEPGVYITLTTLHDGTRDLKRVRFSRRRFGEHQAEHWWNENRDKVYEKYNVRSSERVSSASSTRCTCP
ncbi:PH, RCC1 and FYVE domains-containing protein 1-like isoform X1 [Phragmites australis]|uniref:PH, RCC1 and FYVE domains-containing protein 1-like isoform X1 n=1 Tax=Phragmites australis TaxID=29695 RepID=UPI002D79C666|nr:PH, RCC1 and FYVE domains-containing protein 1-like isoform X1 [Phragmites australis]XP_062231985.1 PH, RCC1 and FYVE domains-containing protein 1-like isoform X1 [Phragmites australis]